MTRLTNPNATMNAGIKNRDKARKFSKCVGEAAAVAAAPGPAAVRPACKPWLLLLLLPVPVPVPVLWRVYW